VGYQEDNQATREWWEKSINLWMRGRTVPAPVIHGPPAKNWRFVLIAPLKSVREFWASNDGMTAWRHRSGYVVPDLCRQEGGCPEVWHVDSIRRKLELQITNLAEIEEYVVLDHKQVRRAPFPEISV
jgi:hypothetical protein